MFQNGIVKNVLGSGMRNIFLLHQNKPSS